ncbi:hypothetical protein LEP1GSC203_0680 [Leptospira terpstrae serovar Hualin str. LT 11-33 = ATCC 700639]|uniref:Uncharacterized protein n=1 Tax=Leptospira terpstrae serovar Hualin str. LT 11-33 = ATCC 700639 TaxID=1257025 RepID=N1VMJ1_9LEPT|nr:hypothetical protein LEP1GSC203_0680 [Leptospira terpstrae serovar Hualin str. LT 11-33 = ATCC 700639]
MGGEDYEFGSKENSLVMGGLLPEFSFYMRVILKKESHTAIPSDSS